MAESRLTLRRLSINIAIAWQRGFRRRVNMEKLNIAAQQNRLACIMERIAASYDEATPKIHHLDRMPLPSREDAAAIMQALEEVIYPGYYSSGGVTHHGIIYRAQER